MLTNTGVWRITVRRRSNRLVTCPLVVAANAEAAVEMAAESWSTTAQLPPVVKIELVHDVKVRC